MIFSVVCMIFLMIGSVSAMDLNVTTDDSNLLNENNKIVFSSQNLEVSSNDSISETNSHDDYLLTSQYISDDLIQDNEKISTSLTGNDTELYFKNGTAYKVLLSDSEGKLLANQSVIFNINGCNYTRTTDNDGMAAITINLDSGNYNIASYYAGTGSYEASSNVNIVKVLSTIYGEDLEKFYKNATQYHATFLNGQGALLNNTTVVFNINGVFYERRTDENGTAQLNINLDSGEYILTAINTENGETQSNNITVLPTIYGDDITKYYKNDTQYYATFVNETGSPLINTDITFNINGVFYTRTTDKDGIAGLNINLDPNNYTITAINPINGETRANNIEILPTIFADDLNMSYRSDKFTANVIDDQGNPLANSNVTFNINGVFYVRVSDENGDASLNINLDTGTYIITSTNQKGLSISNVITIIKGNTTIDGNNAYIILGTDRNYTVKLTGKENNKTVAGTEIYFKYSNITQTAITNDDGEATICISNLSEGTYSIVYGFEGNHNYDACSGTKKLVVSNSTVILSGDDLEMIYKDGSKFNVTLTDLDLNPMANETITFYINGYGYNRTTNNDGVAGLNINLNPGTYTIYYSYSVLDSIDYNEGSNTIVVNKIAAKLIAEDLFKESDEDAYFVATLLDNEGNALNNTFVTFTIRNITYDRVTNESGVASLHINLPVGYYPITTSLNNTFYAAKTITNHVLVNGTILKADDLDMFVGETAYFSASLYDPYMNPISGATIEFNYTGVSTKAITDSNGVASVEISGLDKGIYPMVYRYVDDGGACLAFITVRGTISLSSLVDAANYINHYIEANAALPESILIGDDTYSISQYLYLLSQAIVDINNGDYSELYVGNVPNPDAPGSASDMGNLNDYLSLANTLLANMDAGVTPNSVDTGVGTIGYDGIVYALTRVVVYYGLTNQLPSAVSIKSLKLYEPKSVLDKENTITDLGPYLSASTNCQVSNEAIVALANQLTYGITNTLDKAIAIYNYVRDSISYSFYYDTHYGAVGTLNAKTGNCVDQSHLSIALYRAAGIPARYVHGTCSFSSGGVYGHVWSQVLIGDTWVVSDTTSTRNSFDNVVNWNNYNYSLKGYYSSISF